MQFRNAHTSNGWKPTALVIDKDADVHRSIHVLLGKDFDVHHAYFPRLAISLLEKQQFNVVITSLEGETPELNQTVERISESKGIPVIGLTENAAPSPSSTLRCVAKPLDASSFQSTVQQVLGYS